MRPLSLVAVLAASLFVAADVHADGKTEAGTPFPDKVAGVPFGVTRQVVADACTKVGGTVREAAHKPLGDAAFCTQAIESIPSLPSPSRVRVDFCGGAACETTLFYRDPSDEAYAKILAALKMKYGDQPSEIKSDPLTHVREVCLTAAADTGHLAYAWYFWVGLGTEHPKILETIILNAFCDDGSLLVAIDYENRIAGAANIKRVQSNF